MASENSIEEDVKNIIVKQLSVEVKAVTPTARFNEDLGADSLDVVELILALEEHFEISITDEEAARLRTVEDAISFIKQVRDA